MLDIFTKNLLLYIYGIKDSLNFSKVILYNMESQVLVKKLVMCFFINVILLIGFVTFYNFIIPFVIMFDPNIKILTDILFYIILMTGYLIFQIFNTFLFKDISVEAIKIEKQRFKNNNFIESSNNFITQISNDLSRFFLNIFFLIQSSIFENILIYPFGQFVKVIHISFISSIYSFEYKWGTQGDFYKNISFFEEYQMYFVGFGFIFAMFTQQSFFLNEGVFAILLPFFILTAMGASPPNLEKIQNLKDVKTFDRKNNFIQFNKFVYDPEQQKYFSLLYFPKLMLKRLDEFMLSQTK